MAFALYALFIVAITLMGCSNDGSTPAKYFTYMKIGDAKSGYSIVVLGLNSAANLDDLWTKYNGKIVIPSKIGELPVIAVNFTYSIKDADLPNVVGTRKGTKEKLDYIIELTFPDNLKSVKWGDMGKIEVLHNLPPKFEFKNEEYYNYYNHTKLLREVTFFDDGTAPSVKWNKNFQVLLENCGDKMTSLKFPSYLKSFNIAEFPHTLKNLECAEDVNFYFVVRIYQFPDKLIDPNDSYNDKHDYYLLSEEPNKDPIKVLSTVKMTNDTKKTGVAKKIIPLLRDFTDNTIIPHYEEKTINGKTLVDPFSSVTEFDSSSSVSSSISYTQLTEKYSDETKDFGSAPDTPAWLQTLKIK